jgi:choline-sulfatase
MSKSARTGGSKDGKDGIGDRHTDGGSAQSSAKSPTRRNMLHIGAGLAIVSGLPRGLGGPALAQNTLNVPKAPNIIVLMTDQERHHRHRPDGWAEKNLPSLQRLKRHGLYFQREVYGGLARS